MRVSDPPRVAVRRAPARVRLPSWITPDGRTRIAGDEIHVWRVDVTPNVGRVPSLARTLAPDETAHVGRLRFRRGRDRYVLAHGALRAIVGSHLAVAPREVRLQRGPRGAPNLGGGGLGYSISYADDVVLIAITGGGQVGVDVERVRPGVAIDVARAFAPNVVASLEALPPADRDRQFFRAWTGLEAYSKARGTGLDHELDRFETFFDHSGDDPQVREDGSTPRWWIGHFLPRGGYMAAVAAPRHRRLVYRMWPAEATLGSPDTATLGSNTARVQSHEAPP